MKAHNNKPHLSPEERQAQAQVAQQLGYSDPKELGDAMKLSKDLKEQVGSLMKDLGFERGPKGPPPPGARGGASGAGGASVATESTEADSALEQLAKDNGFIDAAEKGDINALIQAVKSGAIKDPQIVALVGDIAGTETGTTQSNQLGMSPPSEGEKIEFGLT